MNFRMKAIAPATWKWRSKWLRASKPSRLQHLLRCKSDRRHPTGERSLLSKNVLFLKFHGSFRFSWSNKRIRIMSISPFFWPSIKFTLDFLPLFFSKVFQKGRLSNSLPRTFSGGIGRWVGHPDQIFKNDNSCLSKLGASKTNNAKCYLLSDIDLHRPKGTRTQIWNLMIYFNIWKSIAKLFNENFS